MFPCISLNALNLLSTGFHFSDLFSLFDSGRVSGGGEGKIGFFFDGTTAGKGFGVRQNENEDVNALSHPGTCGEALEKHKTKINQRKSRPQTVVSVRSGLVCSSLEQSRASGCPECWGNHGIRGWSRLEKTSKSIRLWLDPTEPNPLIFGQGCGPSTALGSRGQPSRG